MGARLPLLLSAHVCAAGDDGVGELATAQLRRERLCGVPCIALAHENVPRGRRARQVARSHTRAWLLDDHRCVRCATVRACAARPSASDADGVAYRTCGQEHVRRSKDFREQREREAQPNAHRGIADVRGRRAQAVNVLGQLLIWPESRPPSVHARRAANDQRRTATGHAPRSTASWRWPNLCTSQCCAWRRGLISRRRSAARSS